MMIHKLGPAEPIQESRPKRGLPEDFPSYLPDHVHEIPKAVHIDLSERIIRFTFALGLSGVILAVFFVLIYKFLRWVL